MRLADFPDLVLIQIFKYLNIRTKANLRLASKGNPARLDNICISMDFGQLTAEDYPEAPETAVKIIKCLAVNIFELRVSLLWEGAASCASQMDQCPNLEYLWIGGALEDNAAQFNRSNSVMSCYKLLQDQSSSLLKLDLWDMPMLYNSFQFSNLQMLKTDQCSMESVLHILKLCPQTLKFLCIANSSKDCAWNIPDEFFNIKLPKLKHVILCNSNQAYLDIVVLNTLSTLESLELVDFLTKGHIVNESDVEFFGEKFRARKGFEKLAHLRVDSNLLEFMITGAAKTLETLTVGFESLVDPFRPPTTKLPKLQHLYLNGMPTAWTKELVTSNASHLKTLRAQYPAQALVLLDGENPEFQMIVLPHKYKKIAQFGGLFKRYRVFYGNWRDMFIFPRYSYEDTNVWTGPNGPYGRIGWKAPIMRIVEDD